MEYSFDKSWIRQICHTPMTILSIFLKQGLILLVYVCKPINSLLFLTQFSCSGYDCQLGPLGRALWSFQVLQTRSFFLCKTPLNITFSKECLMYKSLRISRFANNVLRKNLFSLLQPQFLVLFLSFQMLDCINSHEWRNAR